jgi:hypothetical protein
VQYPLHASCNALCRHRAMPIAGFMQCSMHDPCNAHCTGPMKGGIGPLSRVGYGPSDRQAGPRKQGILDRHRRVAADTGNALCRCAAMRYAGRWQCLLPDAGNAHCTDPMKGGIGPLGRVPAGPSDRWAGMRGVRRGGPGTAQARGRKARGHGGRGRCIKRPCVHCSGKVFFG